MARWRMSIDVMRSEANDTLSVKEFYESVMDKLALLDVVSPSLCGEPSTGAVAINLQLEAGSIDEVVTRGMGALRNAIHASGGSTVDWPCVGDDEDAAPCPGAWPVRFVGTRQERVAAS